MKDFIKKAGDFYIEITKKFDGISHIIYERTGKKINVGAIVVGILLVIILGWVIKVFLQWLITLI